MNSTEQNIGRPEDVRRWAENRRIANALEVRDLRTAWNTPERSFTAARELLAIYARVIGWPPPDDQWREREVVIVRDRFVTLRTRLRP